MECINADEVWAILADEAEKMDEEDKGVKETMATLKWTDDREIKAVWVRALLHASLK